MPTTEQNPRFLHLRSYALDGKTVAMQSKLKEASAAVSFSPGGKYLLTGIFQGGGSVGDIKVWKFASKS